MTSESWKFNPPADKPNPFQVLELRVDATNAEIVERLNERMETADNEAQRQMYRSAAQEQLLQHPMSRVAYELFEVPGAEYLDQEWERFERAHRKNPVNLTELAKECPPPELKDFNLPAVIAIALDGLLTVPDASIAAAIEHNPFSPHCGSPLEVRDVIFG
jgi:hypothetical protein